MTPPHVLRAAVLALAVVLAVGGCGVIAGPTPASTEQASGSPTSAPDGGGVAGSPPAPGHELYGFVPYWEMDDGIAGHLAGTPLTTIGLFSVTHTGKGALAKAKGYKAIAGPVGRQIVKDAHARGVPVQVVYSSFGAEKNRTLLESPSLQAKVIAALVAFVDDQGLDGVNVDIETLDAALVPAYGAFVGNLRTAIRAADPTDQVSAATGAGMLGAGMAAAAAEAGADRIFLMGYDYRTGRSEPGATSPLTRNDDSGQPSLQTSLDMYRLLGVPPERTLLGLPLYGVTWPVAGPVVGAPSTGRGEAWILRKHLDLLTDAAAVPIRDEIEQVEVYLLGSDGTVGVPPSVATAMPAASSEAPGTSGSPARTWDAVYVDSPATLAPKLALANERGLAGAGFWAVGYERGLPGYTRVMEQFRSGALDGPDASPGSPHQTARP